MYVNSYFRHAAGSKSCRYLESRRRTAASQGVSASWRLSPYGGAVSNAEGDDEAGSHRKPLLALWAHLLLNAGVECELELGQRAGRFHDGLDNGAKRMARG